MTNAVWSKIKLEVDLRFYLVLERIWFMNKEEKCKLKMQLTAVNRVPNL